VVKRRVMLTFPPELLAEPITYIIGQQFNLVTNIRQGEVADDRGWLILELEGKEEDIEAGITWAISKGMRIEPVSDEMAGL
jgi:hypothetical protein